MDRSRWRIAPVIVVMLGAMLPVFLAGAKPAAQAPPSPVASPQAMPAAIASPMATPVAGCGSDESGPTEIAEVFVAAATELNLDRAALCFAPDRQPAAWEDIYPAGQPGRPDDLSDCRGVPYIVTEVSLEPDLAAVIFIFDRPCAIARLGEGQRGVYTAGTLAVPVVVVQVHQSDGRWYVRDAFVSVPN